MHSLLLDFVNYQTNDLTTARLTFNHVWSLLIYNTMPGITEIECQTYCFYDGGQGCHFYVVYNSICHFGNYDQLVSAIPSIATGMEEVKALEGH